VTSGLSRFAISTGKIETTSGLCAVELENRTAALYGALFERSEQRFANAVKSEIRRNVVQRDISNVGDGSHRKNILISTTTRREFPFCAIHVRKISGVLFPSHLLKIAGSFR
jgi:hypothetical protein